MFHALLRAAIQWKSCHKLICCFTWHLENFRNCLFIPQNKYSQVYLDRNWMYSYDFRCLLLLAITWTFRISLGTQPLSSAFVARWNDATPICCIQRTLFTTLCTTMHSQSLSLMEITQHFNLPLEEAAKKLGVCVATLKRTCRNYHIKRWPYRKLRAVERRQSILEKGGHLTPSETDVLRSCQRVLRDLRNRTLGYVDAIPLLDSIAGSEHPLQESYGKNTDISEAATELTPDLTPRSSPSQEVMQMSLACIAPSIHVSRGHRMIIDRCFLPR